MRISITHDTDPQGNATIQCMSRKHPPSSVSLIFEDDVQSVDDTGDVTMQYVSKALCTDTRMRHIPKNGQQDVDEEVSSATTLEEDTERW